MRTKLMSAFLLLPMLLSAQEAVSVKGRIVNSQGEAVEYVQIGIPKYSIGTVSSADGIFEIEVPPDTLQFHHVSYETGYHVVTGPTEGLVIVLEEAQLPPAVLIGGDTKEKYLLRPGTKVLGDKGIITFVLESGRSGGMELGSVARARKPFLVKDILLSIHSNHIPGCVAAINIYRIEGKKEVFTNVLHKPIYFDVAVSDDPQPFDIQPEEAILLEPGQYFIAFQIVGFDEAAMQAFLAKPEEERQSREMQLTTVVYFKSSYLREIALGKMDYYPFNIGIAVKGLEYQ